MRRPAEQAKPRPPSAPERSAALKLQAKDGGFCLNVKVVPRAAKNSLESAGQGVLKARLTAPPVEGAANKALTALLAKQLKLPKGEVRIVSGLKSREKRVWLGGGLSAAEILNRLGTA